MHVAQQQCACVAVVESHDGQVAESSEKVVADAGARRAHERYPLGEETAGDEADDLCCGLVEPLRVVDDADERLLLGDLGEERERRERDQESVGRRPGASAEDRRERVVLRKGQALEMVEHGRAELMKAAVGELHLRLDTGGSRDAPAGDAVTQIAQQGALAHTCFPSQYDRPTRAGKGVGEERVERLALGASTGQLRGVGCGLSEQRRLRNVSTWSVPLNNRRARERCSIAVPDSASPAASRLK